ncbi:hypothetical protein JST56_02230 [Candidatus Dependentiae bacterium]|nr:hypothetical protein [Candidatus Dependentiae bacterium]
MQTNLQKAHPLLYLTAFLCFCFLVSAIKAQPTIEFSHQDIHFDGHYFHPGNNLRSLELFEGCGGIEFISATGLAPARNYSVEFGSCNRLGDNYLDREIAVKQTSQGRITVIGSDNGVVRVLVNDAIHSASIVHDNLFDENINPPHLIRKIAILETSSGILIISGSRDRTAKISKLNGECLATLYHDDEVLSVAALESSQGSIIITGSGDRTAKIWNLDGECLATFKCDEGAVLNIIPFEVSNKIIIITHLAGRKAKIWSSNGQCLATLEHGQEWIRSVAAIQRLDEILVVTGGDDGTAKLWASNGECLASFVHDILRPNCRIDSVSLFAKRGDIYLITGATNGLAKCWTLEGRNIFSLPHNDPIQLIKVLELSNQDTIIATASLNGRIIVWLPIDLWQQEFITKLSPIII